MLAAIERWSPPVVGNALDIGFGSGILARLWGGAHHAATLAGVDPSSGAVAAANVDAPANVSFTLGSAEALPFEDARFDLVWSDQVLQYTSDETKVFEEIRRVLAPGGRAVVAVPNARNLVFRATLGIAGDDRHGSRRTYSRSRLAQLARNAGLSVIGWDGHLPAYPVTRLGFFYFRPAARVGGALERLCDAGDRVTGRAISRRVGFALVGIFERQA